MTRERAPAARTWIAALTLAVFAAAVAWGVASAPKASSVEPLAYPELLKADKSLVAAIATAWGDRMSLSGPAGEPGAEARPGVIALLNRDPGRTALAFLAFLHGSFGKPRASGISASPDQDAVFEWSACWLRDNADAPTTTTMRRMVADRGIDVNLRQTLVVALCRPGDDAAKSALVDVAMDARELIDFRTYVLQRIARCAGPPPTRLRELLYLPFGRIAETTAITLAEWGDFEAPSLVFEALVRAILDSDDSSRARCAHALLGLVGDDAVNGRLKEATVRREPTNSGEEAAGVLRYAERAGFMKLVLDLPNSMTAPPSALDSEFERGEREFKKSSRRGRGLEIRSWDDVVAAKDEDIDLGAALLGTRRAAADVELRLMQLDRLARLVRRDVGPSPTPIAWIDALNGRLLSNPRTFMDGRDESDLADVMHVGMGDCVGLSTLYLAIAERLDLPIRGVVVPGHVFVRWDDGKFRRNIEATDRGAEHDDGWYAKSHAIHDEDVRSGAYLADVTKRRFLAHALVNRSHADQDAGFSARAMDDVEWAIALAPGDAHPLFRRASLASRTDPVQAEHDLRAAEGRRAPSPGEATSAAGTWLALGRPADALQVAESALRDAPDHVGIGAQRVVALWRLNRKDEGERALKDLVARSPTSRDVRRIVIHARVRAGDPSWRELLTDATKDPVSDPSLHLELAAELADDGPESPGSAPAATEVLDRVSALERETEAARATRSEWRTQRGLVLRDRRMYFVVRARCCHALHDEEGAWSAEAEVRQLDAKK